MCEQNCTTRSGNFQTPTEPHTPAPHRGCFTTLISIPSLFPNPHGYTSLPSPPLSLQTPPCPRYLGAGGTRAPGARRGRRRSRSRPGRPGRTAAARPCRGAGRGRKERGGYEAAGETERAARPGLATPPRSSRLPPPLGQRPAPPAEPRQLPGAAGCSP